MSRRKIGQARVAWTSIIRGRVGVTKLKNQQGKQFFFPNSGDSPCLSPRKSQPRTVNQAVVAGKEQCQDKRQKNKRRKKIPRLVWLVAHQTNRFLVSLSLYTQKSIIHSNQSFAQPAGQWAAAAVQRRSQKLGTRSMHWYTGGSALRLDLMQSWQAGWHPRGTASRHWHSGGIDLVHPPQLSQHGHARAAAFPRLASSPPPPPPPPCPLL